MRNVCAPTSVILSSKLVFLKLHIECLEFVNILFIHLCWNFGNDFMENDLWKIFNDKKTNTLKIVLGM